MRDAFSRLGRMGRMGLGNRERSFVRATVDSTYPLASDAIVGGHRTFTSTVQTRQSDARAQYCNDTRKHSTS